MSGVLLQQVVALMVLVGGGHRELGTVFGSSRWDAHNPRSRLACFHREIDDAHDLVVAHNTLPCRSRILIVNPRTHLSVVAQIGDRGPLHADIDLAPLVARRLKHNGREYVMVVPLDDAGRAVQSSGKLVVRAPPSGSDEEDEVSSASSTAASAAHK